MIYLIVAQGARAAVVWTTNYTAKKILRTIVPLAIGGYLIQRELKRQRRENASREPRANS